MTDYKVGSDICKNAFNSLCQKIKDGEKNISLLIDFTNSTLLNCNYHIILVIPTTISIDNCVGYNVNGSIENNSIVKVEYAININGYIVSFGDTILLGESQKYKNYIKTLSKMQRIISKLMIQGETNDEVRIHLESLCTRNNCFPVENTISWEQKDKTLKTEESKYMILNYKNKEDQENMCFEFEKGEVYNINLTIVPTNQEDHHSYIKELPQMYRFNNYHYLLKLASSREFFNKIKSKHLNNVFYIKDYNTVRDRIGIKECWENGILDDYPVLYEKSGLPIFHKKFTVQVGEKEAVIF